MQIVNFNHIVGYVSMYSRCTNYKLNCKFSLFFSRCRLGSIFKTYSTRQALINKDYDGKQKVRCLEYTQLGKSLLEGKVNLSCPSFTFKLMNYNILAHTHMMTHIRNYKNCQRECLNWSFRKGVLNQELKEERADIFCLQEVEESHRIELIKPFRHIGYDALYVLRENKPDGCALIYNASKFRVADFCPVHYMRPEMPLLDRPNVGMVAKLELCDHPGNYIVVANTHFLYNQRRVDIKISQLQILLAEIERIAYAEAPNKYHPVILTGDLNVNSDSCLIRLLRNRYVNCRDFNTRRWRTATTENGRELSVPDELLLHYLSISPDCQYLDVIEERNKGQQDPRRTKDLQKILEDHRVCPEIKLADDIKNNVHIINNEQKGEESDRAEQNDIMRIVHKSPEPRRHGILRHGFPFIDAYQHPELDGKVRNWMFKPEPKQNVYDYIFYSGDIKFKERAAPYKPVAGQLQLLSRLRMPTVSEHKMCFPNLPNYACGSDHLPLSASFLLPVH